MDGAGGELVARNRTTRCDAHFRNPNNIAPKYGNGLSLVNDHGATLDVCVVGDYPGGVGYLTSGVYGVTDERFFAKLWVN